MQVEQDMSTAPAASTAPTPAQASPATNSTGAEHAFRGGGGGRGRGRGKGYAGGRGGKFDPRGRGRFGTPRVFRAETDGKYQEQHTTFWVFILNLTLSPAMC